MKAISDTLKQIGLSTFANFARPQKRERVARQSLLALRACALAKFGEVDTVPGSENSFNVAKVL